MEVDCLSLTIQSCQFYFRYVTLLPRQYMFNSSRIISTVFVIDYMVASISRFSVLPVFFSAYCWYIAKNYVKVELCSRTCNMELFSTTV
jgi:hypothetical protein